MRARNIKPGFYKNEELAEASILARYVAPGLWMMADRNGRLENRPKRIEAELLPYDDGNMENILFELEKVGHLFFYEVNGKKYIQIKNFSVHQSPHHTEKQGIIPPPNFNGELTVNNGSDNGEYPPDSLIPDSLNHERGEHEAPPAEDCNGSRLRKDFKPPVSWLEYAMGKGYSQPESKYLWEKFSSYHISNGIIRHDWDEAWKKWILDERKQK